MIIVMVRVTFGVVLLMLAACGDLMYTPTSERLLDGARLPGEVHLAIGGVRAGMLQARLTVRNDDEQPWRLSPGEQQLELRDGQVLNAVADAPVTIAAHAAGGATLQFALPPHTKLDDFALRWQLQREDRAIAGRVAFAGEPLFPTMPCGAYADPYCLSGYSGGD
jgi:hypothetical protein